MNNKGFIMTEALIISAIVLTALILIYAQFVRIERSYSNEYSYNNVNGLYKLKQIETYIQDEDPDYENIKISIDGYLDVTNCEIVTRKDYCKMLLSAADVEHLLIFVNDKESVLSKLSASNPYSLKFTNFIKSIDYSDSNYGGQLVAEFKDGSFAAIPIGEGIVFSACELEMGWNKSFAYTGGVQEFDVPCTGLYKLEVWGAQGNGAGGAGGYAVGHKVLNKDAKVYVVAGGQSSKYNGGGNGGSDEYGNNYYAGGGATHMAFVTGTLRSIGYASFVTDGNGLIVAGGGGGGSRAGNDQAGYYTQTGGTGGGTSGGAGGQYPYSGSGRGAGGTQTSGAVFGAGGSTSGNGAGGGGGFYGGYAASSASAGGGGSGWIGGVPEVTYKGTTYAPATTNGGNSGNGRAKITLIAY